MRVPLEPATAAIVRTKLAGFLTRQRAGDTVIDDALIVIGEMIANAINHGTPTEDGKIEVSWSIRSGLLELSVHDAGTGGSLKPVDFDADSLSGRGLAIIGQVSDRWWVDMSQGTKVSAELTVR